MRHHPFIAAVSAGTLLAIPAIAQVTQRASVRSGGTQASGWSAISSISADGRYVSFLSAAADIVPGDTNARGDIFVRDRTSGVTELVSLSTGGALGNNSAYYSRLSADGRFVAFRSLANNLVPGDANLADDIFVRDRQAGTTELVSVAIGGSTGNYASTLPSISGDGRFVAFQSDALDLVPVDTNGMTDIFVRDLQAGTTELASLADDESQANYGARSPSISADGRFVAFESFSTNLDPSDNGGPRIYLRDRVLGTTERISGHLGNGPSGAASISGDGRFVAFRSYVSDGGNGNRHIFVCDRQLATTVRADLPIAAATGDTDSFAPSMSADGRYVAFWSVASTLVGDDTNDLPDIFVHDLQDSTTSRVDVSSAGEESNAAAFTPAISADGRYVAFESTSTNLVPGTTAATNEVYVHDREGGPTFTSLCDPGTGGVVGCPCGNPPSGSGRGCDNSSSTGGASLSATGGTYLSSDSLVFTTSGERPTAASLLLQGTTQPAAGILAGQGVRCVGGTLKRLFAKSASGGSVTMPNFPAGDPSVSARSTAKGDVISPGQVRLYVVLYRDPIVLGGCSSDRTFNATQTRRVTWAP